MADDDVREFSKDSPPAPGEGVHYRSKEMVFAAGPFTNVKVGGKKHAGTGFVVVDDALSNSDSKVSWVDADDFNEKWAPASQADLPYNPGPHFDAHEASKEQAEGYQMDDKVKGDLEAGQQLQNPRS